MSHRDHQHKLSHSQRSGPRWLPWLAISICIVAVGLVVAAVALRSGAQSALAQEIDDEDSVIWIDVDGSALQHHAYGNTVHEMLNEAGISLGAHDKVSIGNAFTPLDAPLETVGADARLAIHRALPFTLHDDGIEAQLYATSRRVGDALWEAGVMVHGGDTLWPDPDTPLSPGMRVYLLRSHPLTILADDLTIRTRTQEGTIRDALAQIGIDLAGRDYCDPPPDSLVADNPLVHISRIAEDWIVESDTIPYEVVWQPDSDLELDLQRVDQSGQEGLRKRRYRITYENGSEVTRVLEDEWVAQDPLPRILVYGTKIVLRDIETEQGTKRYWRHMRILATSYTAATSGKTRDHPEFGITFMGWQARRGIIAVDPRVIPLTTNMFVSGYGVGIAGDTGGKIKGRRIDLCYEEYDLVLWYRWVDVYLLEPVPPRDKIPWTLPDWPREN